MSNNYKYIKLLKTNQAFSLIELMIATAILALLMAVAIPNFIAYRNKAYCTQVESDADHICAAIADYFGNASRTKIPVIGDLKIKTLNHAEILGTDPNIHITILVTDDSHRCPLDYQTKVPGWDSNFVFTKEIE